MRRGIAFLTLAVACALWPAAAQAGGLTLRIGAFAPRADSQLFDDDAELYGTDKDDWIGVFGGGEYALGLGDRVELGFHVDGYGRSVHTSYRDFTFDSGREITQTLQLTAVPVGATLRLLIADREAGFVPYVGVGGDFVFWKYEEYGDFIDFDSHDLDIYEDSFISEGVAPGFHATAGAWFKVSDDVGITAEARYLVASDDMGDDFRGYELDLNGFAFTVGVTLRFD